MSDQLNTRVKFFAEKSVVFRLVT